MSYIDRIVHIIIVTHKISAGVSIGHLLIILIVIRSSVHLLKNNDNYFPVTKHNEPTILQGLGLVQADCDRIVYRSGLVVCVVCQTVYTAYRGMYYKH